MIPSSIHSSVRSGAERRIFNVIQNAKRTENWLCLHSLGLARHDTKRLGEIDFVFITTHGVFVLEVKGGRIRRQGGSWIYTDRFGQEHVKSEGPFDQAASAMFTLERELTRAFSGTRLSEVLLGFGVVVPDVHFDVLGPDVDRAQVYDVTDRRRPFRAYVDRLAEFARNRDQRRRRGLRDADIQQVADCLRGDFDLMPNLHTIMEDTGQQLLQLTKEQYVVLDVLEQDPRVIVDGAAGCGKTVLAAEAARRAIRRGHRVLMVCYNRLLADQLRASLSKEFSSDRVVVASLHQLFSVLIHESSFEQEFNNRREQLSDQQVFEELMPELALYAAMEEVLPRFDTVVVDEAQDVLTLDTMEVLSELLQGGMQGGNWWLFLDSNNQASVYGKFDALILDNLRTVAREQYLTVNCRNTKEIAYHTSLVAQPKLSTAARVDGLPVEFISYSKEASPFDKLDVILRELAKDGVGKDRIMVLLARVPDARAHAELSALGITSVRDEFTDKQTGASALKWSTVSGFKGLESDVIILVGVENISGDWWQAVCYVGMSRARMRLYVMLTSECEAIRRRRWKLKLEEDYAGRS